MSTLNENDYLTPQELMSKLKLGRTKIYEMLQEPDFPVYKIGQQYRIPKDEFDTWLEKKCRINNQEANRYGRIS